MDANCGIQADREAVAVPPITLLGDQVLIRVLPPSEKIGRFYVPDCVKRDANELLRGVVIATGPGARSRKTGRLTPCDVVPGDVVAYYWVELMYPEVLWPDSAHRILSEQYIRYAETP